ncbi:FkbM family methyltransferase [Planktomarina temperata]|nr:FkbM family methyltransferase [Planktomarina temperata]
MMDNYEIKKLASCSTKLMSKIIVKVWRQLNSSAGNVHLSFDYAVIKKIPFHKDKVWLRPTTSDVGRVSEFCSNIYFRKSYLHERLKEKGPTVLVDIGGNIGLSSLSLVSEFKSIERVVSIEAEELNYELLKENFKLWEQKYPGIEWNAVHGVATHNDDKNLIKDKSLNDLTGSNSASGSFRYSTSSGDGKIINETQKSISMAEIFSKIGDFEKVIVKIDIEGGEEYLFKSNTDWLQRCMFLTAEVHDKFHPVMINSSTKMIKALVDHDFAFVPANDVIHCYNRKILTV